MKKINGTDSMFFIMMSEESMLWSLELQANKSEMFQEQRLYTSLVLTILDTKKFQRTLSLFTKVTLEMKVPIMPISSFQLQAI